VDLEVDSLSFEQSEVMDVHIWDARKEYLALV